MKKVFVIIAALLIVSVAAYITGRRAGIRHAIEDSRIWIDDGFYLYIDLDGELYEHNLMIDVGDGPIPIEDFEF